jgi:hypothetical protein
MDEGAVDDLTRASEAAIGRYLREHPASSVEPQQPGYRGGTNRITLGTLGDRPIVLKYFGAANRWVNEVSVLRHLAGSGLVPEVVDAVPESLIVMTRLPGCDLRARLAANREPAAIGRLSRDIGGAVARLTMQGLPHGGERYSPGRDFTVIPWGTRLSDVIRAYVRISRRVQQVLPEYRGPFFDGSLTLLQDLSRRVDEESLILFHEDISNLRVRDDRFVGFYDLEMCRLGTVSMQLGVVLGLCDPGGLDWEKVRLGYEATTGRRLGDPELVLAVAMYHLYVWIRVCRWGYWDGDASNPEHREASASYHEWALAAMAMAYDLMRPHVDLAEWFPEGFGP